MFIVFGPRKPARAVQESSVFTVFRPPLPAGHAALAPDRVEVAPSVRRPRREPTPVSGTAETRRQDERRAEALRLARLPGLHLELAAGRKVVVRGDAPPEVAAAVRALRAEIAALLSGRFCLICGWPLAGQASVCVAGGGHAHERCRRG